MEESDAKVNPSPPSAKIANIESNADIKIAAPTYKKSDKVATRKAYGTALTKLGAACDRVCAFDGDTKNSTFSLDFAKVYFWVILVSFLFFYRPTLSDSENVLLLSKTWLEWLLAPRAVTVL